ncbi:transmembrane protein 102 [Chrysemys picta bellii]|uniref:transmembrane protein 102 n=1 Tax=Chrysemys picta bellii TaxID=8478 RepID=UPI0032B266BA
MTSPEGGAAPRPAQPLTDLDFHSGARIAELNQLVQELSKRMARDPGVQELVVLKDFVFSLLGLVQQVDGRLPLANEYLLLSGGARQGTVDVDPGVLGCLAPGADYDADYTLLVPILQARGCPVTLDLRRCPPGHAWLALAPFGAEACHRWADCCRHHGNEAYLAPGLVSAWFSQALGTVADRARAAPRRGGPAVERVAGQGGLVTLLLSHGEVRVLYDVLPVVAFQGWPAAAREWLGRSHFWDGKLREEDVAGGFYLLPGSGLAGHEASGPVEDSGPASYEASVPVAASGPAWREASGPVEASGLAWREASGPVEASGPAWREASGPVEASGPAWREASGPVEASGPAWREASGPVEASGPAWCEASGLVDTSGLAWRLSFSRSELHLKKAVPPPLLQAYRAARAALGGAWGRRVGPYHLWTLVLWACERLPARYLGREENAAHCLLGLLDDMAAGLGAGACPHYFLPGCDRLAGGLELGLAHAVAAVRGDPAGHLRQAVERVKMATKLGRGPDAGSAVEE